MASLSFIIGIIGNIISVLVFTSPIKTFFRVVKKKSTENYKVLPYITTLLSTCLWTFYGLLKPDGLLVLTVNGIGAVFQFIYVTLFLIYAPPDKKIKIANTVAVLNVGLPGSVIAITLLAIHDNSTQLIFVGILCAGLTIAMYASPLSSMRTVIKTKSVEYMPFSLSFFLFLNGGIWCIYSVLIKDFFVGVPNAIGFVLGATQLILYTIYKNKSKMSVKSRDVMIEESPTELVKGAIEMQANDQEINMKNRSLNKGSSMPKQQINRQYSMPKTTKTLSFGPHELHYNCAPIDDVEVGEKHQP
ncbi:bidirectional sugar transporter SWEET17-like [Quercus robur]|uniref:bidirectional sugar transporter SWEET17-like n=1 Tax=Quercus robur TaxID=38942 RepID=UPI002161BA79|nr:bidirectional sugar transporter SWEET17-like [Quercus robur]